MLRYGTLLHLPPAHYAFLRTKGRDQPGWPLSSASHFNFTEFRLTDPYEKFAADVYGIPVPAALSDLPNVITWPQGTDELLRNEKNIE